MIRTRLAAVLTAASVALLLAAPAHATPPVNSGTVSVEFACVEPPMEPADTVFRITFTVPTRVTKGSQVPVRVTLQTTTPAPEGLEPHTIAGQVKVTASGAGSGTQTATGLTNASVPPAGDPLTLTGGLTSFTATAKGTWKFTPGVVETVYESLGYHLVCTPKTAPGVATTTTVV
ncbi:hypothetical protein [Lentzea sp. NPDC060358]|uniref:hypothetical protein n=1 Tax=Lentzea sp. NPDC060358 TaxID=3347103 RepID=UPI0036571240